MLEYTLPKSNYTHITYFVYVCIYSPHIYGENIAQHNAYCRNIKCDLMRASCIAPLVFLHRTKMTLTRSFHPTTPKLHPQQQCMLKKYCDTARRVLRHITVSIIICTWNMKLTSWFRSLTWTLTLSKTYVLLTYV